jgi:hypothetical protein
MGLVHGAQEPLGVRDGLVLYLDAANARSYPRSGTTWFDRRGGLSVRAVEVLVVAGGGGGSSGAGGGGGAGGLLAGSISLTSNSAITVTVGNGGTGAGSYPAGNYSPATSGGNSSFSNVIAIGGGSGGGQNDVANSGGSGGGGGGGTNAPPQQVAGIGTAGQGNSGASGVQNSRGGGGGGSGSAGSVVTGGSSTNSSISGTSTAYAGGGGAGTYSITAGNGGGGGAGNGTQGISVRGGDALANTGSGGGGGGGEGEPQFRTAGGGNGGSGIVIVRYQGPQRATGGTVTSVDGYTIHTFTTSGTFTPNGENNGTLVNGVGYNSANFGSLVFDGVNDDKVVISSSSSFEFGTGNLTVSGWGYVTSHINFRILASTRPSNGDYANAWHIGTNANGTIFLYSNAFNLQSASNVVPVNQWFYWTFTRDTGIGKLFVNTIVVASGSVTNNYTLTQIGIGDFPISGAEPWAGRISQVSIYNRALTAQEIQQNFNATRSRFSI